MYIKKTHLKAKSHHNVPCIVLQVKATKDFENLEAYNTNDYFSDKFKYSILFFLIRQGGEDELLNSNNGIGLENLKNQCLYYIDQL